MRHGRIGLRSVPVTLTGFDMNDITDSNFSLPLFARCDALAGCDHENLIAIVYMPPGRRAGPSPMIACRVRLTGPPVHPAIGVAVSIACSGNSLIFSMRILASVWVRD